MDIINYIPKPGGGSMVYPSGSGIPIVVSGTSWGTTVAAPSGTVVGTTDTMTLTNKRNTPRAYQTTDISGTPGVLTPEIANYDYFELSAQAHSLNIANPSSSTPTAGEKMVIVITGYNGALTGSALTYGTKYVADQGVGLPTAFIQNKTTALAFIYNGAKTTWSLVALNQGT